MKIYTSVEFCAQEFPQPPWLIKGLLPGFGITMIYAFPKVGKSILSVQLAHSLATGAPFLGRVPVKTMKVLYVQCDLPQPEWQYQIETLGLKDDRWSTVWLEPGILERIAVVEDLKKKVKDEKFEFVIYDSLLTISSEKSNLDDEVVTRHCLRMLQSITDAPSVLIHHKRKGSPGVPDHTSTSAAGSYALSAGVSTLFDLKDGGLHIRGRFIRADVELKRGPEGIWVPKSKEDTYKAPWVPSVREAEPQSKP